jgi:N-formylglutamate amidohydrolase
MLSGSRMALILDCHSFPDTPLRRDLNQQPGRPDFNIGTDPFHTPQAIVDAAVDFFRQEGFTLGINRPYEGTMVPAKYFRKDNRVMSIMLEVNRKLYLVPGRALKSEHYDKIRGLIFRFLEVLGTTLETFLSGTVQNK